MSNTVFMFSGQGSQYTGMGKDLCENFTVAKRIYEQASDVFSMDVLKLSCEGTAKELSETIVSQPLIFTLSLAAFECAVKEGATFNAVCGFSLGEVTALTATGAYDLETGFKVINERAKNMQKAAEETKGAMFAIVGTDDATVESACKTACEKSGGYCAPVNYNCPGQIVIAGIEDTVKSAAEILSDSGIRVVRLAVNAAFHSKLMESASANFYNAIKDFGFSKPSKKLYSNIYGDKYEVTNVPEYLKLQMVSPVRFTKEMENMKKDGCDKFIEFGPGKTLCGFIRRGIKGAPFCNVEDKSSLIKCVELTK